MVEGFLHPKTVARWGCRYYNMKYGGPFYCCGLWRSMILWMYVVQIVLFACMILHLYEYMNMNMIMYNLYNRIVKF